MTGARPPTCQGPRSPTLGDSLGGEMPARKKPYPPYDMVERAVLSEYGNARRRLARERERAQNALRVIPDLRRVTDPSWAASKARLEARDADFHRTEKENERRLALC